MIAAELLFNTATAQPTRDPGPPYAAMMLGEDVEAAAALSLYCRPNLAPGLCLRAAAVRAVEGGRGGRGDLGPRTGVPLTAKPG
jgi:hypothetical protein